MKMLNKLKLHLAKENKPLTKNIKKYINTRSKFFKEKQIEKQIINKINKLGGINYIKNNYK